MSEDPLALVLRAAPHLERVAGPGGELFLLGEDQRFVLREPLHVRLLQEIDGRRSVLAIIDRLAGEFGDIEVLAAIEQISRRRFVCPAAGARESNAAAWWLAAGLPAGQGLDAGAARSVDLRFAGDAAVPGLVETFESAGLFVERGAATVLVVCEDYLDETTGRVVGEIESGGARVVPMKLAGRTIWLGPALSPASSNGGGCWRCLRDRLERNRPVETYLARAGWERPARRETLPSLPAAERVAASVAALEILELLVAPQGSPLLQSLMTLELPGLETKLHRVVRRAQCPACGDADWMRRSVAEPIRLQAQTRLPSQDGGNRVVTPEETLARCSHLVSAITGTVASLTPFEGRDHPLRPVYAAGYYLCPADVELSSNETFFRLTLGKGRTPAQARASALAETIERYASIWQGDEPSVRARRYDLGDEAIPAPALLHFSAAQYAARADGGGDWRHTAPLPFSDTAAIDWAPCWSLTTDARRYLPLSYCFNQVPQPREERVCPFDPNGHAAGNCREEAILQGFLELVERDAVGIWWYNRLRRPGVDAGERGSSYFAQVRESYHSVGWDLWALDLTTELEIPVIAAIGQHRASGHFVAGFGCHLDRVTALDRAITEANQIFDPSARKTPIWTMQALQSSGEPDFVFPEDAGTRCLSHASRWKEDATDIKECVQFCVDRARAAGLETIVLDYTRPDLVLSTVKVVVPGLRHIWRRLGPGRLYDVPVALGDRGAPLAEDQLNPLTLMV